MDDTRFDDLSRILATALSRHGFVRLLVGVGAPSLAAFSRFGLADDRLDNAVLAKKRRKKKGGKKRCPGKKDKVCHCPPGNTDDCHVTGNGGGHHNHKLDCCCTRNGRPNPLCNCDGDTCSKAFGGRCANSFQCGGGGICSNIVNGIGVCVTPNCVTLTCADFPGQCGPQDDGCGGQTASCDCPNATDTCESGTCVACVPNTCAADFPDQCGEFADGCGGDIDCSCVSGGCCNGLCQAGDECCQANDCPRRRCQDRACDAGACQYTPVGDGQQGTLCNGAGEFCCNGDACCDAGQVCTGQGCCTPLTCAQDYPGQCGTFTQGCGLPDLDCTCPTGECCDDVCISDDQCCAVADCAERVCQDPACQGHECQYTPVADNQPGPLCDAAGNFCCNGDQCCAAGDVCLETGCCTPETFAEACADAGRLCGPASDGCGGAEYDCGLCPSGLRCISGICLARGGKRCKGNGLAGHPCKGKKCKCTAGRRCHKGKCCEPLGDGSRHCNANSDCCPGLSCIRKDPDQHKVCLRKGSRSAPLSSTSTPGLALGALLTSLLAKGTTRLFSSFSNPASRVPAEVEKLLKEVR